MHEVLTLRQQDLTIGVAAASILPSNITRKSLLFSNNSAGTIFVRPDTEPSTTVGIILNSGDSPLQLTFSDYGPLIGREWFAISTLAGSPLYVIEVFLQKESEPVRPFPP